jgi:predicted nuclease with TOPRIM domain
VTDKFTILQKEYDDQKEMLTESNQRERLCEQKFRKLEKAYEVLQKKVAELELNVNYIL